MTARLVLSDDASAPPLQITPRSTAPDTPSTNDIYLDDGSNTVSGNPSFRQWNGSAWDDLTSADAAGTTYTPTTGADWTEGEPDDVAEALDTLAARSSSGASAFVGARVYHNASQSVAHNTSVVLAFNSERYDTDGIHNTASNNSRLTCTVAGKYRITGNIAIELHATGQRQLSIRLNGSTIIGMVQANGNGSLANRIVVTTTYDLALTDYVELVAFQNSSSTLNVLAIGNYSPEFMMERVG